MIDKKTLTPATAATEAMATLASNGSLNTSVDIDTPKAVTTCTYSAENDSRQNQHFQQQHQQSTYPPTPPDPSPLHYYPYQHSQYSTSSPPLPPSLHTHLEETGSASESAADSGSVTFNGNAVAATASASTIASEGPSVSNGNIANVAHGNDNVMSAIFSKAATAANITAYDAIQSDRLETSADDISNSLNSLVKKSSSSHASREDVTSLSGGGLSINSQSTIMHHNNTNNNNNPTKDSLLQHCYISDGRVGNDDDDDGLGPLPPKWETAYTERGELYFIDHNTGTSHWLDPRLSKFQKKSLEDCSDDELPYGWEKIEDSLYGTYYIDHVNRRTQYENPVLEAKRRAAEQRKHLKLPSRPRGENECYESGTDLIGRSISGDGETTDGSACDLKRCTPPAHVSGTEKTFKSPQLRYKFTRNPVKMQGERLTTTLVKSARGLGITIVGGDDTIEEFLQIKSVVPNGPAWLDGQLQTGDVLVYVNDICVLGFTHHEMVNVFQSILPGESVTLEVCRGYPLPFDPNDPNTEVVTTIAVDSITEEPEKQQRFLLDLDIEENYKFLDVLDGARRGENKLNELRSREIADSDDFLLIKKPEILTFSIAKGVMGFGFTIADSSYGQKVKKILDRNCCKQLQEGDILLEINSVDVRDKLHMEVVQVLKDCSKTEPAVVKIQRGGPNFNSAVATNLCSPGSVAKMRKNPISNSNSGVLLRSKTPTADLYSTQQKEILPIRPKTPLVDTRERARAQTPNNELNDAEVAAATNGIGSISAAALNQLALSTSKSDDKSQQNAKSTNSLQDLDAVPFMDPYPKLVACLTERLSETTLSKDTKSGVHGQNDNLVTHSHNDENQEYAAASCNLSTSCDYNLTYNSSPMPPTSMTSRSPQVQSATHPLANNSALYTPGVHPLMTTVPVPTYHNDSCYCYECQDYLRYTYRNLQQQHQQPQPHSANFYHLHQQQQKSLTHNHKQTLFSPLLHGVPSTLPPAYIQNERMQKRVNELLNDRRKVGFSPLEAHPSPGMASSYQTQNSWGCSNSLQPVMLVGGMARGLVNGGTLTPILRQNFDEEETHQYELAEVTLERQALGFGFRIVGGTEEGSQVTVGHIVPGGAADHDHRIATGDEILSIDGVNVVNSSHHKVVSLMGEAALRGQVTMILRRRTLRHLPSMSTLRHLAVRYPYDVIVSRYENEGFGFVIISSANQYYGSTIGKLIPGSPADRCGELKVGDRIIAVNRIEIAGMSHGDVVQLIKESGLHVRLTIGCPKEGNPVMSTSAQASPRSQLPQTQQPSVSPPTECLTAGHTSSSLLLSTNLSTQQHPQHEQLTQNEASSYFERSPQIPQHPQL